MSSPVYILGAGGIGCLVASSIANDFKINYIVRDPVKRKWLKTHNNICSFTQLFNNSKVVQYRINDGVDSSHIPDKKIKSLIISVKCFDTVGALKPLLSKIDNKTDILLVQNGMGVIDELYEKLWPIEIERPNFYQGVISHGVFQDAGEKGTYNYIHAGFSGMMLGKLPKNLSKPNEIIDDGDIKGASDFIRAIVEKGGLNTKYYTYRDLTVYQVQKLMCNSCMNTITSIVDCINYELDTPSSPGLFKSIIKESIDILTKAIPIIKHSKLYDTILDIDTLVKYSTDCGFVINGKNSTSMRQDVLNLRDVEINYINGYVVRLAKKLGITASVNQTIVQLVNIRLQLNRARAAEK